MDDSEDNDGISAAAFDYTISNFVDNLYGYPEGEKINNISLLDVRVLIIFSCAASQMTEHCSAISSIS